MRLGASNNRREDHRRQRPDNDGQRGSAAQVRGTRSTREAKKENFNDNIVVPDNEHPYLLRLYMRGDISLETLTLINKCVNIFDYWDKELKDDIMWPDIKLKAIKYDPFMSVDINKYKGLIISYFNKI